LKLHKENISIIGLGFVGLSIAVVNASKGFHTYGIDIDTTKIKNLEKGKVSFFEPQLEKYLKSSLSSKKIEFSNDFMKILDSDITFLTVGTPPKKSGEINLSSIKSALKQISKVLEKKEKYHLLVVKSTLTPETTKKLIIPFFKKQIAFNQMDVVVNPEFLQEGVAIKDVLNPHIIVIGAYNKKASQSLIKYYKKFYKTPPEIMQVGITTAELIKYANNSFLATKISFINSIANICQKLPDVDVDNVAYAIGKDNRIGSLFLKAGPGFGGSCLPKDLSGLISFSKKIGNVSPFFEAVENVNKSQPEKIFTIMKTMKILAPKNTVSILGLSFKKNTDDIRESVAIKIVEKCLNYGLKVKVHDSMAIPNFKKLFSNKIKYHKSITSCLQSSDCCIILTDSDEYKKLQSKNFLIMSKKNVIDTRRILNHKKLQNINFHAIGWGQKN
jgi:UDPglucose 6-dehydrogenase